MDKDIYNRYRILRDTGYLDEMERQRKQRADEAAKRWREGRKRLQAHRRKKVGGGGFPFR